MLSSLFALLLLTQAVDVQVELIDPSKPAEQQPVVRMGQVLEKLPRPAIPAPSSPDPEIQQSGSVATEATQGGDAGEATPEDTEDPSGPPKGYVPHPFPFQVWEQMKPGSSLYVVGSVETPSLLVNPEKWSDFYAAVNRGLDNSGLSQLRNMIESKHLVLATKSLKVTIQGFVPTRGLPGIQVEIQGGSLQGQIFVVPIFMVNDYLTRGDAERRVTFVKRKMRHAKNVARAKANAIDLTSIMMNYAARNSYVPPDGRDMVLRLGRGR